MPNTASARKRVRQSASRHALNQWRKRRIKEQIRSFLKAVHGEDVAVAEAEFRKVCGVLDKIAATKTIHRNNAARRKSRLAARLNALKKSKA